jgi:hypothetical protein
MRTAVSPPMSRIRIAATINVRGRLRAIRTIASM